MKKLIEIALTTLLGLFLFSALCYAKEPIHIGLSAPMTGQYAEGGRSFQEGVEVAIEAVNKAGGINGRQIELIIGDSKGEPKIAKRVARHFVEDERIVAEIGDLTSSCSLAAQPVYHRAGMVQLSPTSSHRYIFCCRILQLALFAYANSGGISQSTGFALCAHGLVLAVPAKFYVPRESVGTT